MSSDATGSSASLGDPDRDACSDPGAGQSKTERLGGLKRFDAQSSRALLSGQEDTEGDAAWTRDLDLIIRNGSIVDGTGSAPRDGDVAVKDGRIVAVRKVAERAAEEIDARGRIVTPGF